MEPGRIVPATDSLSPLPLALLSVPQRWVQPACLVHKLLLGPLAGVGEVPIRIAHHPLGTVVVVLDGDVDRHLRSLPHDLSVSLCPCGVNGRWSLLASETATISGLRQRVGEQPGQQPDQRHVRPPEPVLF